LSDTQITDAGLDYLGGLTNLEVLDLSDTQITDTGLGHLNGLTNLKLVGLSDTQITLEGAEALLEALPNCEISHFWINSMHGLRKGDPKTNPDQN